MRACLVGKALSGIRKRKDLCCPCRDFLFLLSSFRIVFPRKIMFGLDVLRPGKETFGT